MPALVPECPMGFPWSQLERELDAQQLARLQLWMRGQTGAICEGRRWNPAKKEYEADECASSPHGMVVYASDVARWLEAGPIID